MRKGNARLINRIQLKVSNIEKSKRFYKAVIEVLGLTIAGESSKVIWMDDLIISEDAAPSANVHLAFQASHPAAVKLFHNEAINAGGRCLIEPRKLESHSSTYHASVMDPDGNIVEAVFKWH